MLFYQVAKGLRPHRRLALLGGGGDTIWSLKLKKNVLKKQTLRKGLSSEPFIQTKTEKNPETSAKALQMEPQMTSKWAPEVNFSSFLETLILNNPPMV